ncbi:hypothetical protein EMPS_09281 [Entomortierella parvispora]|uniref:Uncharacterized protein n=1 Tax=Entomortierella parvispora TaxID=205924 RepID=A0A9P3HIH6_9FUNG|nr:hypothetical protein EMPS_09281 [Entomortierella parvispora]
MRPTRSASRGKSIPRLDLPPPSSSSSSSPFSFFFLLTILFILSLSLSVSTVSAAVADPALPNPALPAIIEEKAKATKTTRSPTRTTAGTPSPTIPPQCAGCWGVNNTSGMTCYHNTQCIPTSMLCSDTDPCTDVDGDQDPSDPILCEDQLCVGVYFLPVPSPGSGKLNRSNSDCWPGNYYSLFGDTPKYTQSCVQDYVSVPTTCNSWEYLAQSSCFLSTCKDDSYCETPFLCVKRNAGDQYGICSSNGTLPGTNDAPSGVGGSAAQYSSKEYLIQGLLIGTCCLALGVGLGVGFWHYRNKRRRLRHWTDTTDDGNGSTRGRASSFSSAAIGKEGGSFLRRLFFCRGSKNPRPATGPTVDELAVSSEHRGSVAETESREGSIIIVQRPSLLPAGGRWRWNTPGGNGPRSAAMDPEFEPPPMYHNGPRLPTYGDSTEDIALTDIPSLPSGHVEDNHALEHTTLDHESRTSESAAAVDHPRNNSSDSRGQDPASTTDLPHDGGFTLGDAYETTVRNGPPPLMAVEGCRHAAPTPSSPSSTPPSPSPRSPPSPKDASSNQRHSISKDGPE